MSESAFADTFAVANWYNYNGDPVAAANLLVDMLAEDGWASFGFIAAEADLAHDNT